jgi:hypothetical protein
VKKCTSCAKDLPDSALHCVFCGAKQAPAAVPGAAQQQAKTVLGYQAGDVVKELARQRSASQQAPMGQPMPPAPPAPPHQAPPAYQPPPTYQPPPQPSAYPPPQPQAPYQPPAMHPPPQPPAPYQPPAHQAPTMFIPGGAGPGPLPVSSGPINVPGPIGHVPSAPAPAPMHVQHPPSAPVPMPMAHVPSAPAVPPYLASQTAARAARPVDPFADGLKLVMMSFGILLLGAFATPISTDPMLFHWNVLIDAPGAFKLIPIMLVGAGALGLAFALMPLSTAGRGLAAIGVGLSLVAIPFNVAGDIAEPIKLVGLLGTLGMVGGLLLRHEYREAQLGRILATIGAVCVLAQYLIPVGGGDLPLLGTFNLIVEAPLVEQKIFGILLLVPVVLAILSLLCWMPAPSTAGAKSIAWAWIVYPAVLGIGGMVIMSGGDVGDLIQKSPFEALMAWVPGSAIVAFIGYGVASVLGKQLE